jgi:hypothetical protein
MLRKIFRARAIFSWEIEVLKLRPGDVRDRKLTLNAPKGARSGSTYSFRRTRLTGSRNMARQRDTL